MRTIRIDRAEVDSTKKIKESEDSILVPTKLTRESILPFADGKGYRPAKELKDAAWTLEGAWVVSLDHIDTVFVTSRADIRGKVENVKFCDKINGVLGDIRFFKAQCDQTFLGDIKNGKLKDVSVAYFCEDVFTPGKFGDEPYDFVQQNFMFGHVAAGVPEGRCPSPFCGMAVDSLFAKHADPEETENFVHIRVRDPGDFVDGSFRTIEIDADKGIKAVIGKLKSDPKGSTVVQKFIFAKDKDWTLEKAQAWVKEHKDRMGATLNAVAILGLAAGPIPGAIAVLASSDRTWLKECKKTADSARSLSTEDLKQKIEELSKQRSEIDNKLWPRTQLSQEEQDKLLREFRLLDAQINALMTVLAEKLTETGEGDAVWDTKYVNDLPDSAFAVIESSGEKDEDGKTVPRDLRHLEHHNAEGNLDEDHVRNAIQQLEKTEISDQLKAEALRHLCKHAKELGIESEKCKSIGEDSCRLVLDPRAEVERARGLLSR